MLSQEQKRGNVISLLRWVSVQQSLWQWKRLTAKPTQQLCRKGCAYAFLHPTSERQEEDEQKLGKMGNLQVVMIQGLLPLKLSQQRRKHISTTTLTMILLHY
jgi:hypothetical protein